MHKSSRTALHNNMWCLNFHTLVCQVKEKLWVEQLSTSVFLGSWRSCCRRCQWGATTSTTALLEAPAKIWRSRPGELEISNFVDARRLNDGRVREKCLLYSRIGKYHMTRGVRLVLIKTHPHLSVALCFPGPRYLVRTVPKGRNLPVKRYDNEPWYV